MHKISLICTDATTPGTVKATTQLKIDDKEIDDVRLFNLRWDKNSLPVVRLEFAPDEVEISVGADTTLMVRKADYHDSEVIVKDL